MPRAGVTREAVIARAEGIVDEHGPDALRLADVATSLGIRQPSLYKHVAGHADVLSAVATRARWDLADALSTATVGRARGDAVRALARAFRQWASAHPGRYATTVRAAEADDAEAVRSSDAVVQVALRVLSGYGLDGDDAIDATRALRAAVHGFTSIELAGGFGLPQDRDRSFDRLVDMVVSALDSWGR